MMDSQEFHAAEYKKNVFFSGVMILTLSTVLVKIIGLLYKIPMLHCLGSVGMGYFNAAYECYALIGVVATAGLPIAVSMLIAEQVSREDKQCGAIKILEIENCCLRIFVLFGILGSTVLLVFAASIAKAIGSPQTAPALRAVAPTMLFSCLSASYRGYFQGLQNMRPTAISQIIEAVGKLVFGVVFAIWAQRNGHPLESVAAMAMLGLTLGVAVSCGYLIVCRTKLEFRDGDALLQGELSRFREVESRKVITKQLLSLAIPITLSGSVLSITKIADMTLILHRLQDLGQKPEQASALYGIYTTITVPVFNLIPSLLGSIALALIPTLSAAIEAKNIRAQSDAVHTAMRLTTLLSVPASFALAVYSRPIVSLLFSVQGEELVTSARLLSILAASVAFSGLITTTNAILQAYGKTKLPIISMLIGSGIKLLAAVFLIGRPSVHIYGAPVSTLLCNSVIVGINLYMIAKHSGVLSSLWGLLFSPMLLSLPSVGIPALLFSCLLTIGWSEKAAFILMVPLTIVILLVLSLKSGMLEIQELESIANGKLYRMLDRYLHFLLPKKE